MFIDRDPEHFGLILNFLRDGVCVLPVSPEARRQLLQEADFYQVCTTDNLHGEETLKWPFYNRKWEFCNGLQTTGNVKMYC